MPELKVMKLDKRPICQRQGCKNGALMVIGKKFYCGPCVVELDRKKNEMIENLMGIKKDAN